jgi:hypothetical protein
MQFESTCGKNVLIDVGVMLDGNNIENKYNNVAKIIKIETVGKKIHITIELDAPNSICTLEDVCEEDIEQLNMYSANVPNMLHNELDKHYKYKKLYGCNEIYHGLGLENEVYLEFSIKKNLTKQQFMNNRKRERYSVDYNNSYHMPILMSALDSFAEISRDDKTNLIQLPFIFNSHSLIHCDKNGNTKTTYAKNPQSNPHYDGKSLFEVLCENNEWLKDNYEKTYTFDGDTVEFMTTQFYNANMSSVLREIIRTKTSFISNINSTFDEFDIYQEHGKLSLMSDNHPFAVHLTNLNNHGMFNNGTYHINITLPTKLGKDGLVQHKDKFILKHKNYIKYIQYLEPLFIAMHGAPDVLATIDHEHCDKFAGGSQRCSVSRYISVGTFDTDLMQAGKILTVKVEELSPAKNSFWWYNKFHENSAYKKLDEVGLDINFNKHFNHGVELRFFDHIADDNILKSILQYLIHVADYILDNKNSNIVNMCNNPIHSKIWNNMTEQSVRYGKNMILQSEYVALFNGIFNTTFVSTTVSMLYEEIFNFLKLKYCGKGKFSARTIQ